MKRFLGILVVVAMIATMCISSFAGVSLDAMYANVTELQFKGKVPDSGLAAKAKVQINEGDKLYIIGWALNPESNLDYVYWVLDGESKECSGSYRARTDVAAAFGLNADYAQNSGFGLDGAMMELVGVDGLANGSYKAKIVAKYVDGSEEDIKAEFDLVVGDQGGEEGGPTYNNFPMYLNVELEATLFTPGITVTENDDGSVLCETESGDDPWISFALDEIDTGIYTSFKVEYVIDGELHPNNVYLMDTEKNPGYSGTMGTWAIPGMQGDVEKTFVIAEDFAFMEGTKLTGVRFPGAKAGGSLLIKSITFINPYGYGEERDFDSTLGDGLSFDWILLDGVELANGNSQVIAAKKGIDGRDGSISTVSLYGWYGNANSETVALGYKINDEDIVFGDYIIDTDAAVTSLNANNRRFMIDVDVSALTGSNVIWVYARLQNGDVVKLNRFDNRGTDKEKDREIYVIFNGPATAELGDADGDGEITDWDAIVFERYLAGWNVEIVEDALDLDNDGEVSDWDAIILARYLAGWNVEFG